MIKINISLCFVHKNVPVIKFVLIVTLFFISCKDSKNKTNTVINMNDLCKKVKERFVVQSPTANAKLLEEIEKPAFWCIKV